MRRIRKYLTAIPVALSLCAAPVLAAHNGEPVKLTDSELDQVTAGELLDLTIQDTTVDLSLDLDNVAVNAALVVQASVLGDSIQYAQVLALQPTTQIAAP